MTNSDIQKRFNRHLRELENAISDLELLRLDLEWEASDLELAASNRKERTRAAKLDALDFELSHALAQPDLSDLNTLQKTINRLKS